MHWRRDGRKKVQLIPIRKKKFFEPGEVHFGFSDNQLEALCEPDLDRFGLPKHGVISGREPYWAAEIYSFGRGLRMLARFPQWVPIPANLEHGVDHRTYLEGDQDIQKARYFLAWQGWRARAEEKTEKKIHLTLHPMVALRYVLGIQKREDAKGTLIFVPHGDIDSQPVNSFSDFIGDFLSLPPEFHPLVLCVQMRDIEKGLHKELRKLKLPIVSAGDIYSRWFAERFYSILQNFQYSSSLDIGSHAFLSEEMGIHFFLRGGSELRRQEREAELSTYRRFAAIRHRLHYWEEVFSEFPPKPSVVKDNLLDYALGSGVPFSVHRRRLKRLFLREIFLNLPNMVFEGLRRVTNRLKRIL